MIEPELPQPTQASLNNTTVPIQQPLLNDNSPTKSQDSQKQLDYETSDYLFKPKMCALDKLMSVKGVSVKQKLNIFQGFTGCTIQNKYQVYGISEDGKMKKGAKMFKCQEKSNVCLRQCCAPQCRGFSMRMEHKDYHDKNFDGELFLNFGKSFGCDVLCFGRPEVEVEWNEGGRKIILGKVKNPFSFGGIGMEVYDGLGVPKYTIKGSCCQSGVLLEGLCSGVKLSINNADGMEVGSVSREYKTGVKNCCQAVSNFVVTFPVLAEGEDRALLVAATVLIDFMYFEKRCGVLPVNCFNTCL